MAVSTLSKDYAGTRQGPTLPDCPLQAHHSYVQRKMSLTFFLLFQTGLLIVHRPTAVRIGAEA